MQCKWLGGSLGDNGTCYFVPGDARRVCAVVPSTKEVLQIGPVFEGKFKWLRSVEANGFIYCIPSHAERILKITPGTNAVELIGPAYEGKWKWHGGNLAPDGNIYCIPCNHERVLKIDPRTDEVTLIGEPLPGHQKWSSPCAHYVHCACCACAGPHPSKRRYGGLVGADGNVYGVPQNATGVRRVPVQMWQG